MPSPTSAHSSVATFFVILLIASLIYGTVVVVGAVKTHFASTDSAEKFRTFELKRKLADGTSCRYLVFSNTAAKVISDRISSCLPPVIMKPPPVRHRVSPFKWAN